MKFKAAFIDVGKKKTAVKSVKQIGPIEFALDNYGKGICIGIGPLAFTSLPGVHRLIFAGRSPIWDDFFISTMGGGGMEFRGLGINYLSLRGKWRGDHVVLALKGEKGKLKTKYLPISEKKLLEIYKGYSNSKGVFALEKYIYDKVFNYYEKNFRIACIGVAGIKTRYGSICSTLLVNKKFTPVRDWAGRGGFGSMLAKHGVVGIAFGGDAPLKDLDMKEVNKLFQKEFGKDMMPAIIEVGKKYRYDEKLGTGGTFGSNFTSLKDWFLSFNWQSIYFPDSKRKEIYDKFIRNRYLKQFNEEIIIPKKFMTCGEPCPIACKKVYKSYKKDYEPYEANGPNCGVFDQRAAEVSINAVDELGFDAIEVGTVISWIMEMTDKGLIDLGVGKPKFSPDGFDVVKDSMHNARIVEKLAELIVYDKKGEIFRNGIRVAAKELTKKNKNKEFIDTAVYTPNRKEGCIAPCQYWVPAFFLPLPIQGKFLSDYKLDFKNPKALGASSIERTIKELYSDNMGVCRFHRGWTEKLLERILDMNGKKVDFWDYHRKLAVRIAKYNYTDYPKFWESERVVDVLHAYLEKILRGDPKNKKLKAWVGKFRKDKWSAAKDYWKEILRGINEGFGVKCFEVS